MKPTELDIRTEGSIGGREVLMGLDDAGLVHIMSVLTDLYSDPVLAVIREYSCNARDSHVEARQSRPVEITLPSHMNNHFVVQDFGLGLSVDEIIDVYSKYGASTKRESNEVVGMLGLGSKSGLTYTAQFSVVAVKDGVKTSVLVGRNADGRGEMEIVDTVSTDEHNGVTINIPTKYADSAKFAERARVFFRSWKPGTVLVNGEEPEPWKGDEITSTVTLVENESQDYVIMGDVTYAVDRNNFDFTPGESRYGGKNWAVVARVPIGTLAVTPSREALNYTKQTLAYLEKIRDEYLAAVRQRALDELKLASTPVEAYSIWKKWNARHSNLLGRTFDFKGETPPELRATMTGWEYSPQQARYNLHGRNAWQWSTLISNHSLIITGFDKTAVSANDKKKIRKYIDDNLSKNPNGAIRYVVIADEIKEFRWAGSGKVPSVHDWLAGVPTVGWDTIRAIRLKSTVQYPTGPNGRATNGGYRTIATSGKVDIKHDLSPKDKIVFYTPADVTRGNAIGMFRLLEKYGYASWLVEIERNRWDAFLRVYKDAAKVENVYEKFKKETSTILTKDEQATFELHDSDKQFCDKMEKYGLVTTDPKLLEISRLRKLDTPNLTRYNEVFGHIPRYNNRRYVTDRNFPLLSGSVYNMDKKYMQHAVYYINSLHEGKVK